MTWLGAYLCSETAGDGAEPKCVRLDRWGMTSWRPCMEDRRGLSAGPDANTDSQVCSGEMAGALTVSTPRMNGWISQWYGYRPGVSRGIS